MSTYPDPSNTNNIPGVMSPVIYDDMTFLPNIPGVYHDVVPEDDTNIVSSLIISSTIYKEAFSVLSADRNYGTSYLSLLEMIPYSHEVRDENFWDKFANAFGGTSGYDKAVKDAFNAAMDEIRSLMQDYYSFLSKLPSEQVNQLRDAGINAAVTGEGVTSSSMSSPDPASLISPNTPQSEYSNTNLSQGITSFVEFIGSMANLTSVGVNSKNILGLLDIAEREGYNKQEVHDLFLAQFGVTSDSEYRVLNPRNTPSVSTLSNTARSEQRVKSAEAKASADALDSAISVNIGNDPDGFETYEIKSGRDWLNEISRFQIANRFADVIINNLRSKGQQLYADVLSRMEGEYQVANFAALTDQANFNSDFFSSRDGSVEGSNQTDLSTHLTDIKKSESDIRAVEAWLSQYKSMTIEHWGNQLHEHPELAPYFYKALFDFDMEDTFYHSSEATMGIKYGSEALNALGNFLSSITGLVNPFKKGVKKAAVKGSAKTVAKGATTSK